MLIIDLNRNSDTSLTRQIYNEIRDLILKGDLKAGERLPSSRELADGLSVSRIVVVEAYELLLAEGFLESRTGSGTYVASGASLEPEGSGIAKYSRRLTDPNQGKADFIDFRSGIPALDLFPRKKWAGISYRICMDSPDSVFGYGHPEGEYELREAIVNYLKKTRGVVCDPDQALITSGSVQGLVLAAQALLSSSETVIVEDPANRDIRKIFAATGAQIIPAEVDHSGIITKNLRPEMKPALVQVTPSHQFPLGGNLPIQRRIELIQFARITGSYIVEDDYDSEFRYEGPPVGSLQGLDPEKVIYLGTFSKILFPALRIGYLIAPWELVEKMRSLKRLSDMHTNSLNQLTLADFIREGHLQRHIFKMKKVYRRRRDVLVNALHSYFSKQIKIIGEATGLHLVAEFEKYEFSERILSKIIEAGLGVYPVENHAMVKGLHTRRLIFGYGHLKEELIEEGIGRLSRVLS